MSEFGQINSGRIAGIAADPNIASTLYIAAAGGGVWESTDSGSTWIPLTDFQQTVAMGAIAVAPSNGSVIYAGTGEANNSADSQYGRGILVSTNGGTSWTLRTGPANIFNTNFLTSSKIAIHPTNPNIAYAAMANVGDNASLFTGTGIYKTIDGGVTWANVTAANGKDNTLPWSDVAIDPNTPTTLYAANGTYFPVAPAGVYKSTDSGATWNLLPSFPNGNSNVGRISIAIAPSNSQTVYVSVENTTSGGVLAVDRSDDGGATIHNVTPPNYMGAQGWYDQAIIVDRFNAARVFITGSAGTGSMKYSLDSGGTWVNMDAGSGATPHADHHALVLDALDRLVDGDDGGIFRQDGTLPTVSWTNLNGNLNTIQFEGIALHPTNPSIALGGSQDNGTEKFNNDLTWLVTDGGDGGRVRFNLQTPTNAYRVSPVESFGVNAFFRKSTDTGSSWSSAVNGLNGNDPMNFYAPFTVDPTNGNHALFCSNRVYETLNFAALWTPLGNTGFSGNECDAVAIAPSDPTNTFYVANGGFFATSSQVLVTNNHGTSWAVRNIPTASRVADIVVDPTNAGTAYAVTSTFSSSGHVFKTINSGTTWTQIGAPGAGLPDLPTWAVRQDPANLNTLYVANDIGVYQTTNGGTSWSRFGTGLPNVQVLDLDLNSTLSILGAGTHGRGMWEISTAVPATTVTSYSVLFGSQSFNLVGSSRVRLPWQVTAVKVVFSSVISFADLSSLTGLNVTGISGLGTNTLTFSISPVSIGSFTTQLLGTGPHAIKDSGGNPITTFSQNFKVLLGDFNDDGIVNSPDMVSVNNARSAAYNIFADMNGNGVVDITDVQIVRTNVGNTQP